MSRNRGQSSGRQQRRARRYITSNIARRFVKFLRNLNNFKIKTGYGQKY